MVPRSKRVATIRLECGHLVWCQGPRFGEYYICDYCTRDAVAIDVDADEVWRLPKGKQTPVIRKLSKPRPKYPERTEPLFNPDDPNGTDEVPF